jgi:hypothetical protein
VDCAAQVSRAADSTQATSDDDASFCDASVMWILYLATDWLWPLHQYCLVARRSLVLRGPMVRRNGDPIQEQGHCFIVPAPTSTVGSPCWPAVWSAALHPDVCVLAEPG